MEITKGDGKPKKISSWVPDLIKILDFVES